MISEALAEPRVVEVMVNPDGRGFGWIGSARDAPIPDIDVSGADAERIMRLLADHAGAVVTRTNHPRVSATLACHTGERFQGQFMPVVASPAFAIRKRPAVIYRLEDYIV